MKRQRWSEYFDFDFIDKSNILALPEGEERPGITPHLEKLYDSRIALEAVMSKLVGLTIGLLGISDPRKNPSSNSPC